MAVAPRVYLHPTTTGFGAVATSASGSIVYRAAKPKAQVSWINRAGETTDIGQDDDAWVGLNARLSPDGRAVALTRVVNGDTDLWILDTERGVPRPFTFEPGADALGVFSPDGRQIVYVSDRRADVWEMFVRPVDGTSREVNVLESAENIQTDDWTAHGQFILYSMQSVKTGYDVWALPFEGPRTPVPIARTPFSELDGRFSPNGRWVAFASNETGRFEVYVQPFPGPGTKAQISIGGGQSPRWRRDGRELFYAAPDGRLMSVTTTLGDQEIQHAPPRSLFTLPQSMIGSFEASADGQRFLIVTELGPPPPISVILNWKPPQK
jgi:Tol biopolymer transport system component